MDRTRPTKNTTCSITLLLALFVALISAKSHTAELVMLEQHHCPYCQKFNREIAPYYHKTSEGKRAPLRRHFLEDQWPTDLEEVEPDVVTPTFILVSNNREVGRIRGYQGDEFFWFLLSELISKLPDAAEESVLQESK